MKPSFLIDKHGTLDTTGIECKCYLDAAVAHGSRPWTAADIPALEAALCADCREDHDIVVLLDEEEGEA